MAVIVAIIQGISAVRYFATPCPAIGIVMLISSTQQCIPDRHYVVLTSRRLSFDFDVAYISAPGSNVVLVVSMANHVIDWSTFPDSDSP